MKLLTSLTSPYGRKVRIMMAEKKIEYELVETSPADLEKNYPGINPLGKIPVLILDDCSAVYDSSVIVDYLDHISPVGRLVPQDHRQTIRVKKREALADGIIDAAVLVLLEQRRPQQQQSIEWTDKQWHKVVHGLAATAADLGDRKWLVNDQLSLADIAAGCMLDYLRFRFPEDNWPQRHPNLAELLGRLNERPEFAHTAPPPNA